jgi:phosphodiesterase/alkaline phosphatase D-like protein
MNFSRREFIQLAVAIGAAWAWGANARASRVQWRERRDLFPEGVASGASSIVLERSTVERQKGYRNESLVSQPGFDARTQSA